MAGSGRARGSPRPVRCAARRALRSHSLKAARLARRSICASSRARRLAVASSRRLMVSCTPRRAEASAAHMGMWAYVWEGVGRRELESPGDARHYMGVDGLWLARALARPLSHQARRRLDEHRAQHARAGRRAAVVERAEQARLGVAGAQVAQDLEVGDRRVVEHHRALGRRVADAERPLDKGRRAQVGPLDVLDDAGERGEAEPLGRRVGADHRVARAARVVVEVLHAALPRPAAARDVLDARQRKLGLCDSLEHPALAIRREEHLSRLVLGEHRDRARVRRVVAELAQLDREVGEPQARCPDLEMIVLAHGDDLWLRRRWCARWRWHVGGRGWGCGRGVGPGGGREAVGVGCGRAYRVDAHRKGVVGGVRLVLVLAVDLRRGAGARTLVAGHRLLGGGGHVRKSHTSSVEGRSAPRSSGAPQVKRRSSVKLLGFPIHLYEACVASELWSV
eukprot:7386597-Prymnesium_polylepis.2